MIDNLIAGIQKELSPHAAKIAGECAIFADELVGVLNRIAENTDNAEFQQRRNRIYLTLAANIPQTIDVPQFEDWNLDLVAIVPSAASVVTIRQGGFLVYAESFAAAATKNQIGSVVQGGTQLSVNASVATELALVFLAEVPKKSRKARGRGEESFLGRQDDFAGYEPERHLSPDNDMVQGGAGGIAVGTNNE